ncbi:MAG TPA: DNA repair protein RecO [Pirellulales bacterium]|jgi:DNA repair protein RecO (recombination protein O)|nr:DNA repair protein RecO [Pirellulales bacterium]
MSSEKATALVLKVVEFSETSSVVTLFTREFGKIQTLAKGARRPKGPFESALDLLALCRIVFLRKSSGALDLLTEAKLDRRFRPPSSNLSCLYAGYYVAELLSELTDDYDPHPALFDLADQTLLALAHGEAASNTVLHWELAALNVLGHLPSSEICVECGVIVPRTERIAFGLLAGGVLCSKCRPGKRQVVSVHGGTVKTMAQLADLQSEAWKRLELDARTRGELRGLMNNYLAHLLGHRPRMHNYLTA